VFHVSMPQSAPLLPIFSIGEDHAAHFEVVTALIAFSKFLQVPSACPPLQPIFSPSLTPTTKSFGNFQKNSHMILLQLNTHHK
jgi:hypothetical protein